MLFITEWRTEATFGAGDYLPHFPQLRTYLSSSNPADVECKVPVYIPYYKIQARYSIQRV